MRDYNYIKVDWLKKRLVDLQFEQVLSEEQMKAIYKLLNEFEEEEFDKPAKKYSKARYEYKGDRCYHCYWYNGKETSIGIACTNPQKKWRSRTSMYRVPSVKACKKHFMRKENI